MVDYVVDIQGFRGSDDNLIPKEVAVIALDHKFFGHWISTPPHLFSELSDNAKSQNNWLSCFYHGIEWFEGDVPIEFIYSNLRDVARTAGQIYIRGREKAQLLQKITSRQIVNLEELTCPSFKKLPDSRVYCFHHGVKKEEYFICALNNAVKLKRWLEKQREEQRLCNIADKGKKKKLENPVSSKTSQTRARAVITNVDIIRPSTFKTDSIQYHTYENVPSDNEQSRDTAVSSANPGSHRRSLPG